MDALTRHRRVVHTNGRKYSCSTCGQSFKDSGVLSRHEARHSNPYFRPRGNREPKIYSQKNETSSTVVENQASTSVLEGDRENSNLISSLSTLSNTKMDNNSLNFENGVGDIVQNNQDDTNTHQNYTLSLAHAGDSQNTYHNC
jgi:hypothetical protein